jgi:hypothetical protein
MGRGEGLRLSIGGRGARSSLRSCGRGGWPASPRTYPWGGCGGCHAAVGGAVGARRPRRSPAGEVVGRAWRPSRARVVQDSARRDRGGLGTACLRRPSPGRTSAATPPSGSRSWTRSAPGGRTSCGAGRPDLRRQGLRGHGPLRQRPAAGGLRPGHRRRGLLGALAGTTDLTRPRAACSGARATSACGTTMKSSTTSAH